MVFVWIDRDATRHELTSYQPIVDEAEAISKEMDSLVSVLEGAERSMRNTARAALAPLQQRLEVLRADLARWNQHATEITRGAAADLVLQIDQIPTIAAELMLVVLLHGEHEELCDDTIGAPKTRADILAGPMTAAQQRAVAACASRVGPADDATRAETKAWLDRQPRFARQPNGDGGWFAWIDRHHHAHRLVDPLPIECEVATITGELRDLKPTLNKSDPPDELYAAVKNAVALMERLTNLQGDLERFDREDDTRDLAECRIYAADWRSKRLAT